KGDECSDSCHYNHLLQLQKLRIGVAGGTVIEGLYLSIK
nr:hypothetical protein [Tanacetum cinerariifolium]